MSGYYAIERQNEMGLSKVLYKTPCGIIVEVATVYLVGEDEINAKDIVIEYVSRVSLEASIRISNLLRAHFGIG